MARAGEDLENNQRLRELQKISRSQYSLEYLDNFVTEWEMATEVLRDAFLRIRRMQRK